MWIWPKKKKKSLHLILLASLLSLTHTQEHGCFLQAWDVRELGSDLPSFMGFSVPSLSCFPFVCSLVLPERKVHSGASKWMLSMASWMGVSSRGLASVDEVQQGMSLFRDTVSNREAEEVSEWPHSRSPAVRTVIMVYIGRPPLLGWSVATLSKIPFISTVNSAGTSWLKGKKLKTLLFFMAPGEGSAFRSM